MGKRDEKMQSEIRACLNAESSLFSGGTVNEGLCAGSGGGGEGGDQSLGTWGKERILTNIQLISILF